MRGDQTVINAISSVGALGGRVLISAIFIASGFHKLTAWQETVGQMEKHGVPAASWLIIVAVVFELAGGLGVLLGCWTRLCAMLLILFLLPVTYYFHDFWTLSGAEQQQQMIHFMKNSAILGGILYVWASGPGGISVDRYIHRRAERLSHRPLI
jgi:putative oxidoreductase